VLPLLLLIIAGITGFGQQMYVKLAVEAAAWSAARHAVASLNQGRATNQAFVGARYALSGFGLNPDKAQAHIVVWGQWGRGTQVRAVVCYDVPSPPIPLGESIIPRRICARQTMAVYRYKAMW
jgi:Flp pilus assembly protein TadG